MVQAGDFGSLDLSDDRRNGEKWMIDSMDI